MRTSMVIVVLWSSVALGQAMLPVDQAVEDLDPLAVSQRQVQRGIGQFSDRVSVYRPLNGAMDAYGLAVHPTTGLTMPGRYMYEMPGVRAWTNRPDYLSVIGGSRGRPQFGLNMSPRVDGGFVEVIPPGTVFDLTPRPEIFPETIVLPMNDRRLDYRLDTRIDARVYPSDGTMPPPIVGFGPTIVLEQGVSVQRQIAVEETSEDHVVDESDVAEVGGDQSDDTAGE